MKFLTIEYIKQHSRVEYGDDDELIALYGAAAEDTVLSMTGRSLEELMELGGGAVPPAIVQAALLLCDHSYEHRSVSSPVQVSVVPYSLDCLIKPYMKL